MKYIYKLDLYDEFCCIADRCSFTCCKGWDIAVDKDTYHRWSSDELKYDKNVNKRRNGNMTEYNINLGSQGICPFLNEKSLCRVVIDSGEEYQPNTCKLFPRQANIYDNIEEYSLSCTCPEVVDRMSQKKGPINLTLIGENSLFNLLPEEFMIREAMMTLLKENGLSIEDRILLIFDMLSSIRTEPKKKQELILRYQERQYKQELIQFFRSLTNNPEDNFVEIKELFLDIVENYKKEKHYKKYLFEIADSIEKLDIGELHIKWKVFNEEFNNYRQLIENCLITKVFADCINEDIEEMLISFQLIITEYLMIRTAVFLKWLQEKEKLYYLDIRDYIVLFSRIIEYNSEGIREFWEESFDEAIWELGYILLLMKDGDNR